MWSASLLALFQQGLSGVKTITCATLVSQVCCSRLLPGRDGGRKAPTLPLALSQCLQCRAGSTVAAAVESIRTGSLTPVPFTPTTSYTNGEGAVLDIRSGGHSSHNSPTCLPAVYKEYELRWKPPRRVPLQVFPEYRLHAGAWDRRGADALRQGLCSSGFTAAAADAVLAGARAGRLPCDFSRLQERASALKDLESSFVGLSAVSVLEQDPRVLRYDADEVSRALLLFQDQVLDLDAGEVLPYLGSLLVSQPVVTGQRLRAARHAFQQLLGVPLPACSVSQLVLRVPDLQSRLEGVVHLLGKRVASKLLQEDPGLLAVAPELVASAVRRLRGLCASDPIQTVNQQLLADRELLRRSLEAELQSLEEGRFKAAAPVFVASKRLER